jgi:hypothetical protein
MNWKLQFVMRKRFFVSEKCFESESKVSFERFSKNISNEFVSSCKFFQFIAVRYFQQPNRRSNFTYDYA